MIGHFMSAPQLFKKLKTLHNVSLLCVGPVTTNTIIASLQVACEHAFPLFLIASRNQIDTDELGGGYINSWNQTRFIAGVRKLAEKHGFPEAVYFCRDHGGPWQRDNELNEKIPRKEAFKIGLSSFFADIEAGFDVLHIDPTKNPFLKNPDNTDIIVEDTIALIKAIEERRDQLNIPPVSYEVGTEDIKGGLTQPEKFQRYLHQLTIRLQKNSLPLPDLVVGQTGTLTKLDGNYGFFQPDISTHLSTFAREKGFLFKEHNADHLDEETLKMHPVLGISTVNVAPEFGVTETKTLIRLSYKSPVGEKFRKALKEKIFSESRWRKWIPENLKNISDSDFRNDPALSYKVLVSCGHYYIEEEDIVEIKKKMFHSLSKDDFDPEKEVINSIKQSILRYVHAFNMAGMNKKLIGG